MKIKIGIVDDDYLIVDLMTKFLQEQQNCDILFSKTSGQEAIDFLAQAEELPHILLIDLKMKEMNGVELTQFIKHNYPELSVIIISSHYQDSFLSFMIKHGVAAFLPKGISLSKLIDVINEVNKHGFYLLPTQIEVLRNQIPLSNSAAQFLSEGITEREIEILKLIAMQNTAKEIGELLFISTRTVEGHKNNLFLKTGTKNIAGLVLYAIQKKILNPQDIFII